MLPRRLLVARFRILMAIGQRVMEPSLINHNAVASSCQQLDDGLKPCVVQLKCHKEQAWWVLVTMILAPTVISHNAAISSCQKAGQWELSVGVVPALAKPLRIQACGGQDHLQCSTPGMRVLQPMAAGNGQVYLSAFLCFNTRCDNV